MLGVPAPSRAAAPAGGAASPGSVVLAFAPARADSLERELARAGLSLAVMSAAEGSYTNAQLVLERNTATNEVGPSRPARDQAARR